MYPGIATLSAVNLTTGVPTTYGYVSGPYNSSGAANISRYRVGPGAIRVVP
jgi:hypothetical protein